MSIWLIVIAALFVCAVLAAIYLSSNGDDAIADFARDEKDEEPELLESEFEIFDPRTGEINETYADCTFLPMPDGTIAVVPPGVVVGVDVQEAIDDCRIDWPVEKHMAIKALGIPARIMQAWIARFPEVVPADKPDCVDMIALIGCRLLETSPGEFESVDAIGDEEIRF